MRKIAKFKIYKKCKFVVLKYPKKILKFKHSKWKFLQLKKFKKPTFIKKKSFKKEYFYDKKNLKKKYFFDAFLISSIFKRWLKKKKISILKLTTRNIFSQLFDSTIKHTLIKKSFRKKIKLNQQNILIKSILQFEYQLDILLHRLNFYPNIYESRTNIKNGSVLLNGLKVNPSYKVKKGDVIHFLNSKIMLKKNLSFYYYSAFFFPFVECDYYAGNIVITKDMIEISVEDFSLFCTKYISSFKLYSAYCKH